MSESKEDFSEYLNLDVGSYHLTQLIGSGGMGAVFLATHNVLHKRVALKLLREQHRQDKETARNFFAEAKAAAGTGHENVIQVFDVDEDPKFGPFMVMEYLSSAESLATVIRRDGALSFSRIRKITMQIAGALSATHARGVVHCDLKPSNILLIKALGQTDVVKLIDFGIAKTINSAHQPNQGPKIVRGTPKYMSPEQVAGKPLDGRSDEYSLGILVYLMLTGVAPFSTGSPAETMRKQYYDAPPPISEKRGDLPPKAEAVLLRALEKKPDARFPDILTFAQTFSDALPPDEKEPERHLPPLLVEEFASQDQELFDGPSLIGLQPIVPAHPSNETPSGSFKRTLPRMPVFQPNTASANQALPPLDGAKFFASPQSAPSHSGILRTGNGEQGTGGRNGVPPTGRNGLLRSPEEALFPSSGLTSGERGAGSGPEAETPRVAARGAPGSAPSVASILSNEPSAMFPPLNAERPIEPPPFEAPPESPVETSGKIALGASPANPEPPKAAEPQDIFNLGRSFSSSSLPIVKEEDLKLGPTQSGSYELPNLEPEKPISILKEEPKGGKSAALHGPKRPEEDSGSSSIPYWLAFFTLAGCVAGWCYLSGFFGGFVLAMPAKATSAPQSTSASAPATQELPVSAPTKPRKKKSAP